MANETFDLVIIGSGPGGYVAAIRAAQLGMKVAVVEKRSTFGGTCLNVGCIPSKALLQSSHLFEQAGHELGVHGIKVGPPTLDLAQFMKRKTDVVDATTKGVAFLFKKNKIASFQCTGRIEQAGSVAVLADDGTVKQTLTARNILIASGSEVTKAEAGGGVTLTVEPAKGGAAETVEADVVLVCIGRRPFVDGLGLEKAGVKLTERGRIAVDGHFQTSVPGIYAIGDVIDGPMLAHKASEDGVACVETIAGQKGHVNWDLVPSIIYTQPEVAWVGKTEEQLKAAGTAYKVGKYPFTADPRSRANGATEGFVKVLADKTTDKVLGIHVMGAEAGTMIAEAGVAMEFSASAEDIGRVCHAHPTVNEAMKEAALAAWEKPIHL